MANPNSNRMGNNGGRLYSFVSKPVEIDLEFQVSATDAGGLGIVPSSLKGAGVQNVFMHTTATVGKGNFGYLNPNPASGFAMIQLNNNYGNYIDCLASVRSPNTGSSLAINSTALTIGNPYVINAVGAPASGAVTIAPVADVAGSLAGTNFKLYDAYGNTFVVWLQVAGKGVAPSVPSNSTLVAIQVASGATAATIGAQLVTIIGALTASQPNNPSAPSGVFSFTASGTTTVTLTSTVAGPLPGVPADGSPATGFTFVQTVFNSLLTNWQAVGLPKGLVPTIGQAFIATATGSSSGGGSTGTVMAPGLSGVDWIEVIGNPSVTMAPIAQGGSPNVGGFLYMQFLASTSSSVTTLIPTAPTIGSIIDVKIIVDAGSVVVSGQ